MVVIELSFFETFGFLIKAQQWCHVSKYDQLNSLVIIKATWVAFQWYQKVGLLTGPTISATCEQVVPVAAPR
jgi:hypothetical protein